MNKAWLEQVRQRLFAVQHCRILCYPGTKPAWGGVFKLKDTGYPVFRFCQGRDRQ